MGFRTLYTLSILLTALAMVPAGAHLFSLANKINLAQEPYFITQNAYRSWSFLGIFMIGALLANITLTVLLWQAGEYLSLTLIATIAMAAALIIFFVWTYPANAATKSWTSAIANWESLRAQWEYSHAVNAGLIFLALCCVTLSAVNEPSFPPQLDI